MSEGLTKDLDDGRSFEERVFARFDALDARFEAIDTRFEAMDARFDGMETRFNAVHRRFDAVDTRFDTLDARVEALEIQSEKRAVETKPIWERALAEIMEVKKNVAELSRKIDVLTRDIVTVRADQVRLDDRIDKIDAKPS
jgi:archaellum component FlaC